MSNLKQLDLAFMMYSQDYDEKLPRVGPNATFPDPTVPSDPKFNYDGPGKWWKSWASDIYPYVKSSQVYLCPSNSEKNNHYGTNYGVPWYAINTAGVRVDYFHSNSPALAAFKQPSQSLMITEKGGGGGPQYVFAGQFYAMAAPHFDGGNVAFVDGHVKWFKFTKNNLPSPWDACYEPGTDYCMHPPAKVIDDVF